MQLKKSLKGDLKGKTKLTRLEIENNFFLIKSALQIIFFNKVCVAIIIISFDFLQILT